MFEWYKKASKCYVYLEDLKEDNQITPINQDNFERNIWWERGWTLQELIASAEVVFYSSAGVEIGNKADQYDRCQARTGIDKTILFDSRELESASIAQKMSWASARKTTRPEDMAYSLMGLFDVNMPMLYGEGGTKAFLRLQEEIMKTSNDQSIFAWKIDGAGKDDDHGLLADHPSQFKDSAHIVSQRISGSQPYTITNKGLNITLRLLHPSALNPYYTAALDCPKINTYADQVGIFLKQLYEKDENQQQYRRVRLDTLASVYTLGRWEPIYVPQKKRSQNDIVRKHAFILSTGPRREKDGYEVKDVMFAKQITPQQRQYPPSSITPTYRSRHWLPITMPQSLPLVQGADKLAVALRMNRVYDNREFWILIGSMKTFEVGFDVGTVKDYDENPEGPIKDPRQLLFNRLSVGFSPQALQYHGQPIGDLEAKNVDEYSSVQVSQASRVLSDEKTYNIHIVVKNLKTMPESMRFVPKEEAPVETPNKTRLLRRLLRGSKEET